MSHKLFLSVFTLCATFSSMNLSAEEIFSDCNALIGDHPQMMTSQFAVLSSLKLGINIDTPIEDANLRMQHEDYRVLVFEAHKLIIPGFGSLNNMPESSNLICDKLGFRFIEGLDNPKYDPPVRELANALIQYMKKYNWHIVERVKSMETERKN